MNVLSDITQIGVVDAAMSNCRVNSGVDGDIPDIIHEEGITANVTDRMERAALSVHTLHQWFARQSQVDQQHKQQITIRLHKIELVISKLWK